MIKFSFSSLSLICTLFLISCREDQCHDLDYGDKPYDPISLTYEAWDSVTAAIFIDSSGSEFRFDLLTDLDYISNPLQPDSCEGYLIFISHSFQHYLRRFTAENNTTISFAQVVGFLDGEDNFEEDHLADILKLSVYDDNMSPGILSRICIITSDRGGVIDQATYNDAQFIALDSLVILNKIFYNVYEQKVGTKKLYYSPVEGVVSFTDNSGTELVLDRLE